MYANKYNSDSILQLYSLMFRKEVGFLFLRLPFLLERVLKVSREKRLAPAEYVTAKNDVIPKTHDVDVTSLHH
jgi:hypothetical protein